MSQINSFDKLRVDGEQSRTINLQPLKGFRDFLPKDAISRNWLKQKLSAIFEAWGYDPIETPTLESLDLFKGLIGEDEKLFYSFKDRGDRNVVLRYDQTVPACRVVALHQNDLAFPFRRYQIQPNFRAENPQKGRYREFWQVDADIWGVKDPLADAEVIALSLDTYRQLGFKKVNARINNRSLLRDFPYEVLSCVDKLGKIGKDGVLEQIQKKGFSKSEAQGFLERVQDLKKDETLEAIFSVLSVYGFDKDWFVFDPCIVRSFAYSDGTIWEIEIPGYEGGSVLGGERYDNLVYKISGKDIVGTGFGLGFDRTLEACEQFGLVPNVKTTTKVLVTVFSKELLSKSIEAAQRLREGGVSVELFPDPAVKLDKQLKYADKRGISFAVIIGPEEAKQGSVTLKNLATGEQRVIEINQVTSLLIAQSAKCKT